VPGNPRAAARADTATLFAAWLGVLKAGGIAVATMPMLRPAEIATI
jgi:2-aminobenzoate-CoA ligase